jgi:hypothetical protein
MQQNHLILHVPNRVLGFTVYVQMNSTQILAEYADCHELYSTKDKYCD